MIIIVYNINTQIEIWKRYPSMGSEEDIRDGLQALKTSPLYGLGGWHMSLIDGVIDEDGNISDAVVIWDRAID